jgi:hypothetical protein
MNTPEDDHHLLPSTLTETQYHEMVIIEVKAGGVLLDLINVYTHDGVDNVELSP